MKLKIRQPELSYSVEIKQLPSKNIFIFAVKKQSKNFVIPIKVLLPDISQQQSQELLLQDSWNNSNIFFQNVELSRRNFLDAQYVLALPDYMELEEEIKPPPVPVP